MVSAMQQFCAVSPKNPSPLSSYPPFRPRSCSPPLPPGSDESSTLGIKHDMDLQERRRSKVHSTPVPIHRVDSTSTSSSTALGNTYSTTPYPHAHPHAHARPRHPNSIPSPSSSTQLDGPLHLDLDVDALPSPSPGSLSHNRSPSQRKLSTSHSLAGSYTLSLLSSRMSHAHKGHSLDSAFTLQIGATGFNNCNVGGKKTLDAKLKSPPHVRVPFEARWYDLEGGPGGAAVGTPWVGCVDLEGYYRHQNEQRQCQENEGMEDGHMADDGERVEVERTGRASVFRHDPSVLKRDRRRSSIPTGLSSESEQLPRLSGRPTFDSTVSPRPGLEAGLGSDPGPHANIPFPGYELAPQGLLQLVIKNEISAIKVFLLKYDLAALEPGGKMLVRERDYIAVPPVAGCRESEDKNEDEGMGRQPDQHRNQHRRREVLRSAVELQFTCVPVRVERKTKRKRHTEPVRREHHQHQRQSYYRSGDGEASSPMGVSIEGDGWRLDGGSALSLRDDDHGPDDPTLRQLQLQPRPPQSQSRYKTKKAYFLSRHVRVVFPSLCGNLTSRDQADRRETAKEDVRTERFIEVINPSTVQPGMSPKEIKKMRRASFASESWEGVKALLSRKMKEDEEDDRMDGNYHEVDVEAPFSDQERKSAQAKLAGGDIAATPKTMTFPRSPTPVHSGLTSLLTARLERREGSVDTQVDEDDRETELELRHWHRELGLDPALPSPVTSPVDKKRSLWPEDESERLLSESLQRLPWRR
ncbi:hypothetical protein HD553DRAFT_192373 [Filobasidium floriforme]|uniref:uncharacterized protein n=1 Tax=Filobasidium floriforme TaxID=5210 RepID=UPI001E8D7A94|nr:uncharacterized protein HD553DRAFT_192373 [Filobasidium floriforme]KAH8088224.1 hypothetical protein HD553DRAFT_192373 [Filobasidium floriforme]